MENFIPADYEQELNGKAFSDNLGEFSISALPVENMTTKNDFFIETLQTICTQEDVKRIMIIGNDEVYDKVSQVLRKVDDDKRITVFSMEPRQGGNFRQEILGFSLMAALGIKGEEINKAN